MSPSFPARLGLSITNPRWALAIASDRSSPRPGVNPGPSTSVAGRSGTDLFVVILLVIAATELRGLFSAAWLGIAVDAGLGLRAAIQVLTRALTVELAFLVIAALLLWLVVGNKRDLGRAFDLACVAALPLLFVDLAATVVVRTFELAVPSIAGIVLAGISYAWAGALVALAVRLARRHASSVPPPPTEVIRPARGAGWAVIALLVTGAIVQSVWIARHSDAIRPMTQGDPAPPFTLPTIVAGGAAGPAITLGELHGKVIVLDFWATWCGPCIKAMPKLELIARNHPDVAVIAINLDDPVAARTMWDTGHYTMKLVADDGHVSTRYGVSTIPHSVVIDRNGTVRHVARGSSNQLDVTVRALLGEQIRK